MVRSKIAEKISAKTSDKSKKKLRDFVTELAILQFAKYKVLKAISVDKNYDFVFLYNPNKKPVRSEYNIKSDYNGDYNAWKRQLRTIELVDKNEERRVWNYFFVINNSIEKTWSALEKGINIEEDLILIKYEKLLIKAYLNPKKTPIKFNPKKEVNSYDNLRLIIMDELNKFTDKKGTVNLNRKDFTNFANHTSKKINEAV